MMSSIGGAMPGTASMQALRQQAFTKADASGNGSLDAAEFKELVGQAPGGRPPPGVADVDSLFKAADSDGNGALTQTELEQGLETAMQAMRSTLSMAGGAEGMSSGSQQDGWKALLEALRQDETAHAERAVQRAYGGAAAPGLSVSA
jgi:EF-hand domain pair